MGCCAGVERNINSNNEIFVIPQNDKQPELDITKNNNEDYNKKKIANKKEIKNNEEPIIEFKNQNLLKNDKNEISKDKEEDKDRDKDKNKDRDNNITPKTDIESDGKLIINNQKKRIIKKGSQRVQQAALKLRLLSLKELDNNKKYFTQN